MGECVCPPVPAIAHLPPTLGRVGNISPLPWSELCPWVCPVAQGCGISTPSWEATWFERPLGLELPGFSPWNGHVTLTGHWLSLSLSFPDHVAEGLDGLQGLFHSPGSGSDSNRLCPTPDSILVISLLPQSLGPGSPASFPGILGSPLSAGPLSGGWGLTIPLSPHVVSANFPHLEEISRATGWGQLVESGPWERDKPEQAFMPLPTLYHCALPTGNCFPVMYRLPGVRSQVWIPDLPLQSGLGPSLSLPIRVCSPRGKASTGRRGETHSGNMAPVPGTLGASLCGRKCIAPKSGGLRPSDPG